MITFFRNIRKGLLHQSRMAKYLFYALGEILLVVIGILIALSINNWNEQRKKDRKEQLYLSGLKEDFLESQKELKRIIKKSHRVKNYTERILSIPNISNDTLSDATIDSLIARSQGYTIFMTSESTLKDLISSGNLNIISNDTLRGYLASWEADLKYIRAYEELNKKSIFTNMEILNEVSDSYNYNQHNAPLFSPAIRKELLKDLKFRNIMDDIRRYYTKQGIQWIKK